jgi:hypothetical protein
MDENEKIKEIAFELESEHVKVSGEQRFVYSGQSMWPILKEGDCLLTMNRKPLRFFLGDLVVYRSSDDFVVHRFLCYGNRGEKRVIVAKPDNSFYKDVPIREDFCVGKVIKVIRSDVGLDFRQGFLIRSLNYMIGLMSFAELVLVEGMQRFRLPIFSALSLPRRFAVKIGNYYVTERIR